MTDDAERGRNLITRGGGFWTQWGRHRCYLCIPAQWLGSGNCQKKRPLGEGWLNLTARDEAIDVIRWTTHACWCVIDCPSGPSEGDTTYGIRGPCYCCLGTRDASSSVCNYSRMTDDPSPNYHTRLIKQKETADKTESFHHFHTERFHFHPPQSKDTETNQRTEQRASAQVNIYRKVQE